jgi:hypothetical protein
MLRLAAGRWRFSSMAHPEHSLQTQILRFVKDCVECSWEFLAFDRSQNHSGRQHMWEAARGVKAGTPDTLLLVPGKPAIFCELKAPGNKPTPVQDHIGHKIQEAGHDWFWADSVQSYRMGLMVRDVPLRGNACLVAEHRDALLLSARIKAEEAPKKRASAKPFTPKPSASRLRKSSALRLKIPH